MEISSSLDAVNNFFLNGSDNFEDKIKKCISWNKDDWSISEMFNSSFYTLISSLKYWHNQLVEAINDKTVSITIFNIHKEAFIDLNDIIDSIYELSSNIKIVGYNRFQNKRYIGLEFETEEMKLFILQNLKTIKNDNVVFLDWVGQSNSLFLKVQWLPSHININKVKDYLSNFVEILEEEKIETKFRRGQIIPSGDFKFKCKLLKNVTLNSIPHFCNIGKLKGFIIIAGRDPICLTCYNIGHISYQCPTPFCKTCKKLKPSKHLCDSSNTYADKLKNDIIVQEKFVYEEWGNQVEEEKKLLTNQTNLNVDKINVSLKEIGNDTADISQSLEGKDSNLSISRDNDNCSKQDSLMDIAESSIQNDSIDVSQGIFHSIPSQHISIGQKSKTYSQSTKRKKPESSFSSTENLENKFQKSDNLSLKIAAEFDKWNGEDIDKTDEIDPDKCSRVGNIFVRQDSSKDKSTYIENQVPISKMEEREDMCLVSNMLHHDSQGKIDLWKGDMWGEDTASDVDTNGDSDIDLSEVEAIKNFELYIKELNTFKIGMPVEAREKGGEGLQTDNTGDNLSINMEVDNKTLKKKINDSGGAIDKDKAALQEKGGWVKCYGRKGG